MGTQQQVKTPALMGVYILSHTSRTSGMKNITLGLTEK
jgi:hypothetical protein